LANRTWFRIHSFTGVVTGLMLFVICWSGTFAVLAKEIDWLVTPAARAEVRGEWQSWGAIMQAVEAAYPEARIRFLRAPLYRNAAAEVVVALPRQRPVRVYVDPYLGEVRGAHSYFNTQRFLRTFHMNLFLGNIGYYVVMTFALTMLVSLGAALVFYRRWWRRFLHWPQRRGRAFWSELHRTAGLWSIWFLLVIGVTGGWYLYEKLQSGPVHYVGPAPLGLVAPPTPSSDPASPSLPLDEVMVNARSAWPALDVKTVAFGRFSDAEDTVYLDGQAGFPLVRDRANQMHLDPRTAEVLWQNSAGDLPVYWLWSNMADPLHFGDFGGLWSKAVWFVFGLVLSGLILTGTWLHAHRLAREPGGRTRHRWPGTGAAIVVSLAVLTASVPFGIGEARSYGPVVDGVPQFPDLAPGVAAVIFGWIALTLALIAAWIYLLWCPKIALRTSRISSTGSGRGRFREGGAGE